MFRWYGIPTSIYEEVKSIPRKDRAFGVWHTKKQKGNKRRHKGSGGGRRRRQYQVTEASIARQRQPKPV